MPLILKKQPVQVSPHFLITILRLYTLYSYLYTIILSGVVILTKCLNKIIGIFEHVAEQ